MTKSELKREGRTNSRYQRLLYTFIYVDNILITLPSFLILILTILLSTRYCDLHDYYAYYLSYMGYHRMSIEPGYTLLADWFHSIGLPFYVYYAILITITLTLVWLFLMRYARHRLLILLLFLVYPYINYLQQLRSAVGAAIVLTAIGFLISDTLKPTRFIACVVAAALFHSTSVIYLVFLPASRSNINRLRMITWIAFLILPISFSILRPFIIWIISFLPYWASKYTKYLNLTTGIGKAALIDWIIYFIVLLCIEVAIRGEFANLNNRSKILVKLCYTVLLLSLMRAFGNNAYRPALMMLPVMYVAIDNVASSSVYPLRKALLYIALMAFPIVSISVWWGPLFPNMNDRLLNEMWKVWDSIYI